MHVLLPRSEIDSGLAEIAQRIVERETAPGVRLALVGVRRGGVPVAARLSSLIEALLGEPPLLGAVDINLYRDDTATLVTPYIGPSDIPFPVAETRIVLVDDVLYTGRTIRAAVDALLDYGRPRRIELCVVVDRGGRELPIQPDYVVAAVQVDDHSRVEVIERDGGFDVVRVPARAVEEPSP